MHKKVSIRQLIICCILFTLPTPLVSAQKILPDAANDLAAQIVKQATKGQKTRIAVLPFRELGGQPTVLGTYIAEELTTYLVNAGSLDLVERATLDKLMKELKLNESGAIDPATAKQVGKLAGADAIVTGTITDLQSYVGVNCRLIDTQTGRIFAAAETRIVKDDDVKKIMGMSLGESTTAPQQSAAGGQPNSLGAQSSAARIPGLEQNEFFFVVKNCVRRTPQVICTVTVTNKSNRPRNFALFAGGGGTIVDESGSSYSSDEAAIGQFGGAGQVELMPDLPMNFVVKFPHAEQVGMQVSLIVEYGYEQGLTHGKFLFRGIPVSQR